MNFILKIVFVLLFCAGCAISWGQFDCPAPRAPKNGLSFIFERGRMVRYRCHPGFRLHGHKMATCNGTEWSHDPPTCLARHYESNDIMSDDPGSDLKDRPLFAWDAVAHPIPPSNVVPPSEGPKRLPLINGMLDTPNDPKKVDQEIEIAKIREDQKEEAMSMMSDGPSRPYYTRYGNSRVASSNPEEEFPVRRPEPVQRAPYYPGPAPPPTDDITELRRQQIEDARRQQISDDRRPMRNAHQGDVSLQSRMQQVLTGDKAAQAEAAIRQQMQMEEMRRRRLMQGGQGTVPIGPPGPGFEEFRGRPEEIYQPGPDPSANRERPPIYVAPNEKAGLVEELRRQQFQQAEERRRQLEEEQKRRDNYQAAHRPPVEFIGRPDQQEYGTGLPSAFVPRRTSYWDLVPQSLTGEKAAQAEAAIRAQYELAEIKRQQLQEARGPGITEVRPPGNAEKAGQSNIRRPYEVAGGNQPYPGSHDYAEARAPGVMEVRPGQPGTGQYGPRPEDIHYPYRPVPPPSNEKAAQADLSRRQQYELAEARRAPVSEVRPPNQQGTEKAQQSEESIRRQYEYANMLRQRQQGEVTMARTPEEEAMLRRSGGDMGPPPLPVYFSDFPEESRGRRAEEVEFPYRVGTQAHQDWVDSLSPDLREKYLKEINISRTKESQEDSKAGDFMRRMESQRRPNPMMADAPLLMTSTEPDPATFDLSCLQSTQRPVIQHPAPRLRHAFIYRYRKTKNALPPHNQYLEAEYKCFPRHRFDSQQKNTLFCSKKNWVGTLSKCVHKT